MTSKLEKHERPDLDHTKLKNSSEEHQGCDQTQGKHVEKDEKSKEIFLNDSLKNVRPKRGDSGPKKSPMEFVNADIDQYSTCLRKANVPQGRICATTLIAICTQRGYFLADIFLHKVPDFSYHSSYNTDLGNIERHYLKNALFIGSNRNLDIDPDIELKLQNTVDIEYRMPLLALLEANDVVMNIRQMREKIIKLGITLPKCHITKRPTEAPDGLHEDHGKSSGKGKLSNKNKSSSIYPEAPPSSSVCSEPGYDRSHAAHTQYTDLRDRLRSFAHWSNTHSQSPQDLAVAGFFYTGHADCVRCHYCDLALKHWDLNHRPLEEHAHHSPSCGYVKFVCRNDFIHRAQEQLRTILESARESSTGRVVDSPPSDKPARRARSSLPHRSHRPVKCPNKTVSVWFPQCGHFVPCRECAPPHSRCPACLSRASRTNLCGPERLAKEEPADKKQADRTDATRPAALGSVAGESGRSSSRQPQSDSDPSMVDLRVTRPARIAMELSALLLSSKETRTGDTDSEGNEDENGQDILSLDLDLDKAVYFPSNWDIRIPGTKRGKDAAALLFEIKSLYKKPPVDRLQDTFVDLHQTKRQLMQFDDGRPELNPHVTERAPRFPIDKHENSQGLQENDDANEDVEDQSPGRTSLPQQSVQDVLHAVHEATRGIKHPVIHRIPAEWRPLFQEITAQPVVPQSTEEGLARVDFRSPDRERMNVEGFRVGTFLLYPRAEDHAVLRLANAGFYYTGRGDTLACFCCDVTFSYADRRPGEDPYDIHRQLNPNCPHLSGGETRNVFIQDEQTCATSSRDITSEGSEPDEPNTSISQQIAETIARIRRAVRPLYLPAVPNAASQNQNYLLSMEAEHAAPNNNNNNNNNDNNDNNNATHGTNRSFEEPRPGQISHDPSIQTIINAYENGSPAPREGRTMGGGNSERPRQGHPSSPQSGNSSGQWITASIYNQTSQVGINGGLLNPPPINTQESSRPLNEPTRPPVSPLSSAQVNDAFQHSPSNPQPPVSAPSPSPAARQGEASPPSASPAVSDYDPSRAVHAHYTDLQRRQDSFGQWPDTHAQSPEELAVAGFFFTGIGDCVRCHYCGLGLKHWDPDDRPLDEHVRWRSSCGYLRALCGEDVIYRTLARIGGGRNGEAAPAAAAREVVVAAVQAPPPMPGLADRDSRQSAAPRDDVADLMTSEAVVAARAMGFTTDAIERAVTALLGTRAGRRAVTAQNLVNAIIYLQARGRDPESPEASDNDTSDNDDDESGDDNGRQGGNPDDNAPPTGSHSPSNSGNAGPPPVGVVVRRSGEGAEGSVLQAASVQPGNDHRLPNQTSRQTLRELEQENQELRDRRRCKICLDNDISILFLPCGHLVCCAECAPALRRCPMCRRRVTGTVRTHLAPLPACNTS